MRSVLWHFRWFFRSCWANLARALSVPGRSFVLGARNCTAEGYEPVWALLKCAFFLDFPHIFCFFFLRRFEHGRFSCKGGRDMAGKFPTTFCGIVCNRPAAQPSLLSFFYPFLFSSLSPFSHFSLCSHFSLLPSFFFSPFFPQFSSNFHSPPLILRVFHRFLVKATRLHVTPLSAMCFVRHLPHTRRDTL